MNNLLLFGAGRSSLYLIEYLQKWCFENQCALLVCDKDISYAKNNLQNQEGLTFTELDIFDQAKVEALVKESRMVISLLPAALHIHIAKLCLEYNKNLGTASYISEEMKALHQTAKDKGLVFLNECGLDPGIDHMSAMQMMDAIKTDGGVINSFESYCGGLTANESDGDNPWKYKFSWNPRNVVLAGAGAPAQFLHNNELKMVPYHQLFKHIETFEIEGAGTYEAYANRDSLKYMGLYNLEHVASMKRGTFRKKGYAAAWQVIVELGLTDDTTPLHLKAGTTLSQWLAAYLPDGHGDLKSEVKALTHCSDAEIEKLDWLGLFGNDALPITNGTSAQILEEILKPKWHLMPTDKDLIVMLHKIGYTQNGTQQWRSLHMTLEGLSETHTAMAKTVGLPLAIACKLILENKIEARGVLAPVTAEFYNPVLAELETFGICF